MQIRLDMSHWPVVVSTAPPGTVSDEELESYLEQLRERV